MFSLFYRNLFFTLLQPGMVAGLIPWLIAGSDFKYAVTTPFSWFQIIGIVLFIPGFMIMVHCIIRFAIDGRGTLSPADPTKQLVITGLYQYSRNPMYVGVMLILLGETLFAQSLYLLVYTGLVCIAFNLFIRYREEPRLSHDFGNEYEAYKKKVKRWV